MKARDGTIIVTKPYYRFNLEEQADIELATTSKADLEERLLKAGFKNYGTLWKYSKPVVFYNDEVPMVYMACICTIDDETMSFRTKIVTPNGDMEPWYYNREFGCNEMIPKIENKVNDQLNRFIKKGIIKPPRRYEGEEI